MEEVGLKLAANLPLNEVSAFGCDHLSPQKTSSSVAVPSQCLVGHCSVRFPRPPPAPFPSESQRQLPNLTQIPPKRENPIDSQTTPWDRPLVPSTHFSHRFLSSPESTESQQNFMLKNDKKGSARRSLISELEKNASVDGKMPMTDWELIRLSVRELNQRLVGEDRSVVSAVKQKRRTLKNRGYALNCRTRRMRNQQQLEAENSYLRQLVAKQSALLAKYEQKREGHGKGDEETTQKKEVALNEDERREKWHGSNGESAGIAMLAKQPPTVGSCTPDQISAVVPFIPHNGTPSGNPLAQQSEMFYQFAYQPQQFSATQLQLPYYQAMFRGNGTDEATTGQFQSWDQFSNERTTIATEKGKANDHSFGHLSCSFGHLS